MTFFTEDLFPVGDWRWLVAAVLFFIVAGVAWAWPRSKKSGSPEIRTSDTTTYREQPDGSRVVTQTTLAKPVRIAGRGSAHSPPGTADLTAKPPADDD